MTRVRAALAPPRRAPAINTDIMSRRLSSRWTSTKARRHAQACELKSSTDLRCVQTDCAGREMRRATEVGTDLNRAASDSVRFVLSRPPSHEPVLSTHSGLPWNPIRNESIVQVQDLNYKASNRSHETRRNGHPEPFFWRIHLLEVVRVVLHTSALCLLRKALDRALAKSELDLTTKV